MDDISLTCGNPKKHIWTFVAVLDEVAIHNYPYINVNQANSARGPPNYVRNDYFFDTGSQSINSTQILCGMELVVGLSIHVVPSIILHGFTSYHSPPVMTLR